MKQRHLIVSGVAVLSMTLGFTAVGDSSFYARIARSMETFGEVFRNVSMNYVDDVPPETLIDAGIKGMLSSLDPYTTYVKAEESEEIDMLSTGVYTGFGITVSQRDSGLWITNIRTGQPAAMAGVRIGDRLVAVDSVDVSAMSTKDLRPYTRGLAGSTAVLRLVREGRDDTLAFTVRRAQVDVENVTHAELMADGTGYVKLARFSRRAPDDVRRALEDLREQGTVRSLVLDLRDNPGGLLDAAVGIVKLFVPKGSRIVATHGRDPNESRAFFSDSDPKEPTLPLVVLINERSASASEIVAGAIQDLDRGVIVGRRSFGKGLVQTVVPLPYDANLKMTTARYYTPSGRSLQRVDYAEARTGKHRTSDTLLFSTMNGRVVREYLGIEPDTTVVDSVYVGPIEHLRANNVIFRFATVYTAAWSALPSEYTTDRGVVEAFIRYTERQPAERRSPVLADLDAARRRAEREGWPPAVMKGIESAERSAERELARTLRQHGEDLRELLDAEIRGRFASERGRISLGLRTDPCVRAAQRVVTTSRYAGFLDAPSAGDQ